MLNVREQHPPGKAHKSLHLLTAPGQHLRVADRLPRQLDDIGATKMCQVSRFTAFTVRVRQTHFWPAQSIMALRRQTADSIEYRRSTRQLSRRLSSSYHILQGRKGLGKKKKDQPYLPGRGNWHTTHNDRAMYG